MPSPVFPYYVSFPLRFFEAFAGIDNDLPFIFFILSACFSCLLVLLSTSASCLLVLLFVVYLFLCLSPSLLSCPQRFFFAHLLSYQLATCSSKRLCPSVGPAILGLMLRLKRRKTRIYVRTHFLSVRIIFIVTFCIIF